MTDAHHGLPTPLTTLRARYVSLLVWCKGGCQHQAKADLQALDAAEALRQAEVARKARGRLRRAWDGWRGR
jgi:hypothetical protein